MSKKKILIVDDERDALFILAKELTAGGYSIITADNGNDAIATAKSKHPDLIILDVAMPSMDGGETAEKLKEDFATRDIPIIFLTALFPKTRAEERCRVVSGHVFVAKPYDIKELLTQIDKAIMDRLSKV